MPAGKLIVIEGGDGSGKATQTRMLMNYLKKKGIPARTISFPRYTGSFYGKIVGRLLSGEFGEFNTISPYLAALPYAFDRFKARETLTSWLARGNTVVLDRYVTSSMAHQAAKLPEKDRPSFIKWIEEMEYSVNKLPRPDIVLYLHVPWKITESLTKKAIGSGDIAEQDHDHRRIVEQMYVELSRKNRAWKVVECVDEGGKLLEESEIHNRVVKRLSFSSVQRCTLLLRCFPPETLLRR